jgi:hypothetical protein
MRVDVIQALAPRHAKREDNTLLASAIDHGNLDLFRLLLPYSATRKRNSVVLLKAVRCVVNDQRKTGVQDSPERQELLRTHQTIVQELVSHCDVAQAISCMKSKTSAKPTQYDLKIMDLLMGLASQRDLDRVNQDDYFRKKFPALDSWWRRRQLSKQASQAAYEAGIQPPRGRNLKM